MYTRYMIVVAISITVFPGAHNCLMAQAPKEITNSIGIKLTWIPHGTFTMGSPPSEEGSLEHELQHEVTLTKDYYLGTFEVTQSQYQKVIGKNPSYFQGDNVAERNPQTRQVVRVIDSSNYPVERISWDDANEFCDRLSMLPEEKKAGRIYRLPTEAEWEYACRAGSRKAFSFGESSRLLADYAWTIDNSEFKTHPVGEKMPNNWGLYDMHGNVFELCSDRLGDYSPGKVIDPRGVRDRKIRVSRGGSYFHPPLFCRSSLRFPWGYREDYLDQASEPIGISIHGFRIALDPPVFSPNED